MEEPFLLADTADAPVTADCLIGSAHAGSHAGSTADLGIMP